MKYIVVRGNNNHEKPTTIKEVCRQLQPDGIYKVTLTEEEHISIARITAAAYLPDDAHLIQIGDKKLLFQPGAATQQQVPIPALLHILDELGMDVHFAIFAICAYEKLNGFCSLDDLKKFSHRINELKIAWIPKESFETLEEWLKRLSYLTDIARETI